MSAETSHYIEGGGERFKKLYPRHPCEIPTFCSTIKWGDPGSVLSETGPDPRAVRGQPWGRPLGAFGEPFGIYPPPCCTFFLKYVSAPSRLKMNTLTSFGTTNKSKPINHTNQPASQPASQPTSQPASQPANQPSSQPSQPSQP